MQQELFRRSQRLHIGDQLEELEPNLIKEARLEFCNDMFRESIRAAIEKTLDLKEEKSVEYLIRFHIAVKSLIYSLRVIKKRDYENLRNARTAYLTEEENKENNLYHLQNAGEKNDGIKTQRRARVWQNDVRRRSSVRDNAEAGPISAINIVDQTLHTNTKNMNLFHMAPKVEFTINAIFAPFYGLAYLTGKIMSEGKRPSELVKACVLVVIIVVYGAFSFIICWLHGDIFWATQAYWNVSSLLFQTFLIVVPNFLFLQNHTILTLAALSN